MACDASSYLVKPVDTAQLLSTVDRALARKGLLRALRDSEERYRLITESMTEALFLLDLEGGLALVNALRRAAHRVPLRRAHRAADLLGPRPRRRGARPRAAGIGAGRAQGHAPVRVSGGAPRRPPHPDRDDLHEHRARRPRGRAARGGPRHHRAQAVAGGAGPAVVHRGVVGRRHRRPHARGPDRELEPGRGAALRLLRGGGDRPLGLADRAAGATRRAARHPDPPAPRSPHQQLRDGVPHEGGPSG